MTTLLMLVRSAITGTPLSSESVAVLEGLSAEAWNDLFKEAEKQSVTGLFFHALSQLTGRIDIPESVSYPLLARAVQIETRTREMMAVSQELICELEKYGLHPIEMKGEAVSRLYPKPGLREYGDIDLYMPPGDVRKAVSILREHGLAVTDAPDGCSHFKYKDIDIDVHCAYFELPMHGELPPVPSPEAVLLMLSTHMLKHAIGTGVGLRHVCDMAAAYRCLDGHFDPKRLRKYYLDNGLDAWNRMVNAFLARHLGIPDKMYENNDADETPLMRILCEGGVFGHHAPSRLRALGGSGLRRKADTVWRFLQHFPFALRYAPRQAIPSFLNLVKGNLS